VAYYSWKITNFFSQQTHPMLTTRDINSFNLSKNTMGSADSVPLKRAVPDQDEVPVGKAFELGSRYDNDKDDCSCRTDMTTVRASNGRQRCTTLVRRGNNRIQYEFPPVGCSII
jgi:hypothetical protein